ncbi:MAG: hypothetical protein U0521_23685 [Anaerolineae bacterium]
MSGRICADVGASTGGFTDCLLQNGAAKVYAHRRGLWADRLQPAYRPARGRDGAHQRPLRRKPAGDGQSGGDGRLVRRCGCCFRSSKTG